MSVIVDHASSGTVSSNTQLTWNHTCSGKTIIVSVASADFRPDTITSITYGGVALNPISGSGGNFGGINLETIQYLLNSPPTGTLPVVVNAAYPITMIGIATSYSNTDGTIYNSVVNEDSEFGTSTNPNAGAYQFTAPAGGLLVSFIGYNSSNTPTPGANQTIEAHATIGSIGAAVSSCIALSAGAITYSYSNLGGSGYSTVGLVLNSVVINVADSLLLLGT